MAICETEETDYQCPHCDGKIRIIVCYYDNGAITSPPEHISYESREELKESPRLRPPPRHMQGTVPIEAIREAVKKVSERRT